MSEMERYFIKPGYRTNVAPGQKSMPVGNDTIEDSMVFQYEVYEYASRLITKHKLGSVLDLGCGCAMKLRKLILPLCPDITGIDEPDTISRCKQLHKFGTWYAHTLEDSSLDLGRTFDLIISVDVIEHLVDPDQLLDIIKRHSTKETFIVLSTVERDAAHGKNDMGPPINCGHAREWNFAEFKKYVEHTGFKVIRHSLVAALTPLQLQDLPYYRVMIKRVRQFVRTLIGRTKLGSGQMLVLKYEPTEETNG